MEIPGGTLSTGSLPRRNTRDHARRRTYFIGFALVAATLVLAGFTRTFFLPLAHQTFSAPWFVYVHGSLFFCWVALLIAQAILAASRKFAWHRQAGKIGFVLAPLMVITGGIVAFWSSARDLNKGGGDDVTAFFFGELMDLVMFGSFASIALLMRHRSNVHKRFILLATMALLGAAIGRIHMSGYIKDALIPSLLFSMVVYDRLVLHRIHPATFAGGIALVAGVYTQTLIGSTQTWLVIGRRLLAFVPY